MLVENFFKQKSPRFLNIGKIYEPFVSAPIIGAKVNYYSALVFKRQFFYRLNKQCQNHLFVSLARNLRTEKHYPNQARISWPIP